MPPVALPLTFSNSFWSKDFRTGLNVLFTKLEQGTFENDEIVDFVKGRIKAEREVAASYTKMISEGTNGKGFDADDGASLLVAFRGLQEITKEQADLHNVIAKDLQELVSQPFEAWSYQHAERILAAKHDMLDVWLTEYESHIEEIARVRESYTAACRKADEAMDDAKFAPNSDLQDTDKLTQGSTLLDPTKTVRRTPSFTDRVTQKLKDISPNRPPPMPEPKNTMEMFAEQNSPSSEKKSEDEAKSDGTITPKLDKGKGRADDGVQDSPKAMSPINTNFAAPSVRVTTHLVLGGASVSAVDISALLFRAQQEIGVRSVKITLLGEYEHCFTGEEFVVWLKMNLDALKGSLDNAEDAAQTLTEEYDALRRIGELGNKFENSSKAFYQFRAKAFNLQASLHRGSQDNVDSGISSPISNASANISSNLKRSGTMVSNFVKAVQNATGPSHPDELPIVKAKRQAAEADGVYRKATRRLDQHRCAVEERIEDTLKALQRWELDRLKAVKTVLEQFQHVVSALNAPLASSTEKSDILISSFLPESDMKALIETYRTGPFRPSPQIYESVDHQLDGSFGIDLRKWAGEGAFATMRSISSMDEVFDSKSRIVPPVLYGLLDALKVRYSKLENDAERRKTWIYEVPVASVHHLRSTLNTLPIDMKVPPEVFEKYDTPVLASTIKLYLLELDPPVSTWEYWDDVKKMYPSVGAEEGGKPGEKIEEELKAILIRFPLVGLRVIDAVVLHLKELINSTTGDESNDVYIAKLSASLGRSILRPREETTMTIQSNHPQLFLADLVKHYEAVLPPTIETKKREAAQRQAPSRKRTQLVDSRPMRRSIDASADPRKLLEAQMQLKNPNSRPSSPNPAGSGGRPAFVSPPSSPPAVGSQMLPPPPPPITIDHALRQGNSERPSVAVEPPSPVNLNASPKVVHAPPPPPPDLHYQQQQQQYQQQQQQPRDGSHASQREDVSSPNLSRTASAEARGVRGPRTAPRGGGPRPMSASTARAPQSPAPATPGSPGMRRGGSPRNSISSPPQRPRTPPDAKDYLPSKRGGRAAAGSFTRPRPSGDGN